MSDVYQIPGLLITALCHVIVIYYLSEHKYPKRDLHFTAVCMQPVLLVLAAMGMQ